MYFPFFLYLMTPSTSPDTLLFVEFFLAVLASSYLFQTDIRLGQTMTKLNRM
mgnify:CR=1 FL=1